MKQSTHLPSGVSNHVSWFDRFADFSSRIVSKAWFFLLCAALIVVWAPSGFVLGFGDTWQLIINTTTTIVTFLLVALLQNTQDRNTQALQQKLNAQSVALLSIMESSGMKDSDSARELKMSVGLEDKESS